MLARFLDWASRNAVAKEQLGDYRRVAAEILERAGSSRITETHILATSDAYAVGPAAESAVALIADVGDAMLRYQAEARAGASSPRAPEQAAAGPLIAPPAAGPAEAPASSHLRPPVRPTGSVPILEPPLVSFLRPAGGASQSAPPPASTTPAEVPAAAPGPRDSSPPAPAARRSSPPVPGPRESLSGLAPQPGAATTSARQFRCPKCHHMVSPTDTGVCPLCGAAPAHLIAGVGSEAATDASRARGKASGSGTRWFLLLLLGVVVALLAYQWVVPEIMERIRQHHASVTGEQRLADLGLRMVFPPRWQRDPRPVEAGAPRWFFSGAGAPPEEQLYLATVPAPSAVEQMASVEFIGFVRDQGASAADAASAGARAPDCEAVRPGTRRFGRCTGSTADNPPRPLVVYVVPLRGQLARLVFLGDALDPLISEGDEMVATIELLADMP